MQDVPTTMRTTEAAKMFRAAETTATPKAFKPDEEETAVRACLQAAYPAFHVQSQGDAAACTPPRITRSRVRFSSKLGAAWGKRAPGWPRLPGKMQNRSQLAAAVFLTTQGPHSCTMVSQ